MPIIDLGPVVGPQGPQGEPGATGERGVQGNPGPNQITSATSTNLNGVLAGAGGVVGVRPVDSAPNSMNTGNLISSAAVAVADAALAAAITNTLDNGIKVTLPNVSDSNRSFAATGITAAHVLVQAGFAYLSNPAAAGGTLTLRTGAGTVTVVGTLSGTTNITATFCVPRAVTAAAAT